MLLASWLLAVPAAAEAPVFAVLPAEEAEGLDVAVREKAARLARFEVQPQAMTLSHVCSAAELGLRCTGADVSCFVKLGTLTLGTGLALT